MTERLNWTELNNEQCWASFLCFLAICMSSLRNVYLGIFSHFLTGLFVSLVLSCMSCLYIWKLIFCQFLHLVSSHSEGYLFTKLIGYFTVQNLLSLTRSHLFTFVFISVTLGSGSWRILLWFMSLSALPMFSSNNFIVSGLTFRSLFHVEFIFVYGVRKCSNFIPYI